MLFPRGLLRENAGILSAVARVLDAVCVLLAGMFAFVWRFDQWALPQHYQIALFIGLLLAVIIFNSSSIYNSWRGQSWWYQARIVTIAWTSVVVLLVMVAFATKTGALFSREWMGVWGLSGWVFLLLFRFSLYHGLRVMRASGMNLRRIVVVGAGGLGQKVARNIQMSDWAGLSVAGFFDDAEDLQGTMIEGVKVRGFIERLSEFVRKAKIDEVWLALPLREEKRVREVLHYLRHSTATIRFVPNIFELRLLNHSISEVAGLPVLNISESPMYGANRVVKFIEDTLFATVILTLISPLMVTIAIGVKFSSPGPVFFRQERVSWNGNLFMMLKFRSMPVGCESKTGAAWAKAGENRATRFGAFLRKTSLDELPQFMNVLKGDMSIVGPRPERPVFVDKFKDEIPGYMKKHMVKAGITGWAQANGLRGNTDLGKRIEYDLYYIDNWSLWFDIKIIVRTVFSGFIHKNAY